MISPGASSDSRVSQEVLEAAEQQFLDEQLTKLKELRKDLHTAE